jgi:Ca2+-binding EF-hand superfamily protein
MGQRASRRGLTAEETARLVRATKYQERTVREWHAAFRRASGPSGILSQAAFHALYVKFFPTGDARELCGLLFRSFGSQRPPGGDLTLDFAEFLTAVQETAQGSEEQRLARAFTMLDQDGDGLVGEPDLVAVFTAAVSWRAEGGAEGPEARAREVWRRLGPPGGAAITRRQFLLRAAGHRGLRRSASYTGAVM